MIDIPIINKTVTLLFLSVIMVTFTSSCKKPTGDKSTFLFTSVNSKDSGLDFVNTVTENEEFNILEYLYFYNGGGVAIGDINNDNLEDIYLTSNMGQDKLYLNLGGLKFKDISFSAGISQLPGWSTGVNITDIDGDGWKDIYVCRLGQYKKYTHDHNLVYINDKKGGFKEKSKEMGLRFSGFSTQCAFFDMDRDGDLDAYLLNHSVKDASHFKPSDIRNTIDTLSGDILYENRNGIFFDISKAANIYQSSIGYGLGISIADFNNDGWQDIYICNDFHENDYLYLNQKNKRFKEVCKESFGHTSNFSMGVDCDDMDNDGFTDVFTVDMKPDEELVYKNSGGWENLQIYNFKRSYGYHHQQPKNAFQWNRGNNENGSPVFSEISGILGLDATDWSWCPIIADFDMDGKKDLFISNGIKRRPNDLDFVHFISNESGSFGKPDTVLIQSMPEGKQPNHFYRNDGSMKFSPVQWAANNPTLSNGAASADLDNDGDPDLVINNHNAEVTLLENLSILTKNLSITLQNDNKNTEGIGSKITVWSGKDIHHYMIKSVQGFQSCSSRKTCLSHSSIDSVKIIWPEGFVQVIKNLKPGQNNLIKKDKNLTPYTTKLDVKYPITQTLNSFTHTEDDYNDQTKESWMPYLLSSLGPKMALSSRSTLAYMTNSKNNNGILWDLYSSRKISLPDKGLPKAAVDENNAVFFDANGDGNEDLYLCLGGNEAKSGNPLLSDILYISDSAGKYIKDNKMLPELSKNTSVAVPFDFDNDGDTDLFIGVLSLPGSFGLSESSYILENIQNQHFSIKELNINEMVMDAKSADVDANGFVDIILCGHWMPITILYNDNGKFTKKEIPDSEGLWFTLQIYDVNKDGNQDIIAGNFGNNHSLKCNSEEPLILYINDFDKNGQTESLLTYIKKGSRFIFPNKDMFVGQLPSKKKSFLQNKDYAGKTLEQIFSKQELKECIVKTCKTTSSAIYLGKHGREGWQEQTLPFELQVAPIRTIIEVHKPDNSQINSYFFGGNFYNVDPNIGRQDALMLSHYLVEIGSQNNIIWKKTNFNLPLINNELTSMIVSNNNLLIAINNGSLKKINLQDLHQ